jgi:cytochrome P450
VSQNSNLPKHEQVRNVLEPLMGPQNLLTTDGALWKKWRTIFNPGFSVQHLMTQVTTIIDCTEAFIKNLDRHSTAGRVFRLEEEATKVTIDIIGKVACDHDFKTLTADNRYLNAMRKSLGWMPDTQSLNPFHWYNPLRSIFWKYYKYHMDWYLGKVLDERFVTREANKQMNTRKKSGIDLALEAWVNTSGQPASSATATMDAEFRKYAIDQLHTLLFAGHDTTASTLCYCYYLLSKHPQALLKMRQELDEVFGNGVSAGEKLKQSPYLINKCDYTLAVVKETLRLFTPGSTVRRGRKDCFIRDPTSGSMLPTEGYLVWIPSFSMHRDPRYWSDPHAFCPERFLPGNIDKLVAGAFRPFEKGPRNCIGQELALMELRIILACTMREFDVSAAYDELQTLSGDGSLWAKEKAFRAGPQECFGDEAYQVLLAAAKPREGMPVRITRRTMHDVT